MGSPTAIDLFAGLGGWSEGALPPDRRTAIKLLGNAVCPPVAREIAAALVSANCASGARRAA